MDWSFKLTMAVSSVGSVKLNLQECQRLVKNVSHVTSTYQDSALLPNLLRLLPCLESPHLNPKDMSSLRHQIWQCDLIHLIIEVLRNDYSNLEDGWRMRTNLAVILSSALAGLTPRIPKGQSSGSQLEEVSEYYDIILPTAVDSILVLANSLLEAVETGQDKTTNFYECFKKVMDSLMWLCTSHKQCVSRTLQSPYLLHILITDHTLFSRSALTVIDTLILTDKSAAASLIPPDILTNILDELVYKLSGEESEGAALSLKLLAQFAVLMPKIVDSLSDNYSGLLELVMKWVAGDKERKPAEEYLITELESRAGVHKGMKEKHEATVMIQASWRGYASRKKMAKMKNGIRKFQELYRRRRAQRLKREENEKAAIIESTLKRENLVSSQMAFHKKQLSLYERLPASELQDFIRKQESEAAVKIQSAWRGWTARSKSREMKSHAVAFRSAVIIQRAVRHYLQRKKVGRRQEEGAYEQHWPDIPRPTRLQLQQEISRYRETHAENTYRTHQQISELHDKAQMMYEEFYFSRGVQRRRDEQIQLLISKLSRNCDLLLSAPSLEDSFKSNYSSLVESFSSNSSNIAKMARTAHREEMKATNTPWWKRPCLDNNEINLTD